MPQQGEIRRGATESVQWDGSKWQPIQHETDTSKSPKSVDNPVSFGWLDAVPGLRDALNIPVNAVKGAQALPDVVRGLVHEPVATLKGFAQGTSEAATPGRLGLLSLLAPGAGSLTARALLAGGGEALAQGTRVATDAPNAPQSFPEAAGNVAEAASVPALAGVLKAVPGAVERAGGTRNVAGRVLGAGFGGYEGYRYGGLPGMVAGAAGGASLGGNGGSRTLRALRSVIGPGAAEEAVASDVSPRGVDRYLPNRSGVPISREVPGFSMPTTTEVPAESPLPRSVLSEVDRYMPNSGGAEAVQNPIHTGRVGLTGDAPRSGYGGPSGRVTGKALNLNAVLHDAVNSLRDTPMTAGVQPIESIIENAERVPMTGLKAAALEPELVDDGAPPIRQKTGDPFIDDMHRMQDEALSRRSDPVQVAANKAKMDDWNRIQDNIRASSRPMREPIEPSEDPSDTSASIRGLQQAIGKSQFPSSSPRDAEMEADIIARQATGKWKR